MIVSGLSNNQNNDHTQIANNLPHGKLWLWFNFPSTFSHLPRETGNGNYEALKLLEIIWNLVFQQHLAITENLDEIHK